MREIKFRAWDKIDKRMRTVTRMTFALSQVGHLPLIIHMDDGTENPITRSIKDVILLQFTGLMDKNSKEIYEGNIVRNYVGEKFIGIGKIVFGNYNVSLDSWGIEKNCQGYFIEWAEGEHSALDYGEDNKVIGNIYENPELLKAE